MANEDRPANTIEEQALLPGVAEKCAQLRAAGHGLAVASNQGGVAFGHLSLARAEALVAHAADMIGAEDWELCPHHPEAGDEACLCRKPAPGMLLALMYRLGYPPEETVFVGDQESDRLAALAAGCGFVWAEVFFGWGEEGTR
jgi:D-glycero-D-manno-heptose 1,7-bisphosphate phosphatase